MNYGILANSDWNPQVEMWPDGSVCIVRLNDDGSVFIDQPMSQTHNGDVGIGLVYNKNAQLEGFVAVPLDATVHLFFNVEADAIEYALNHYTTDIQAIRTNISGQLRDSEFAEYIDYGRHVKRAVHLAIGLLIIAIIILLLLYGRRFGILTVLWGFA